ncbi:MAG: hypothetical protein ACRDLM_10805 [Gaiellaceae bacterium]
MSFFEPPPPPPEPPPQLPRRPWQGPPDGVIGHTIPLNLVIGRAEKAAVWIPALTVYRDGFEFEVEVRHRLDDEQFEHPFFLRHHHRGRSRDAAEELPAELLRLGIEFSDGRKATNLGGPHWLRPDEPDTAPEGPLLQPSGGGGGGAGRWRHGFYLWPLPPAGPLAFVCEWPAAAIELTRSEIDTDQLRAAATNAVVLWEDDPAHASGRGVSTQYMRAVAHGSTATELDARAQAWLDENRDALRQRLREAGIVSCPACSKDSLELSDNPLTTEAVDGDARKPKLQFECTHCGHLLLFDARKLGYTT